MSREPRTSDDRKGHALAMREQARDVTRAAIARHRVVSMLMAFLGPLGGIAFSAWLLTEVASDDQLMALLPAVIGVGLGSGGAWMVGVCRPLPTHLLATGVATPAAILEVTTIGPTIEFWHNYKDGKLDKQQFDAWMAPVREQFEAELKRAVDAEIAGVSGSCANILEHQPALWTFAEHEGVEPTNNHAERELRAFVLWRKRSFGTQSERGNRFAERLMTVAHTARKQGKNVLEFLTACCRARAANEPAPSLLGPKPNEA
jgi:hypothetical protein